MCLFPVLAMAQGETAKQNRGLFAFVNGTSVQVSWRMRASDDPYFTKYELYANGKLVGTYTSNTTARLDANTYKNSVFSLVVKDLMGNVIDEQNGVKAHGNEVLDIPLHAPQIRNPKTDAVVITYTPGDCSAYDMDGDGEQEIILKWMPSVLYDSATGIAGNEFFDCYKLDGTCLWRIDMGQNSVAGNNMPFMCWDFDGDGKGEMIVKSAPGTKDASGAYVGEGLPGYDNDLTTTYFRGSDGLPTKGEEWVTCFDGVTGKELASCQYWPYFGIQSNWNPGGSSDGVNYGRRGNGLKGNVIYIPVDGEKKPCCYMQRGIYSYVYAIAIAWDGKELKEVWRHASDKSGQGLFGEGAHTPIAADLDGDGYDEVAIGAAAIDHDGTVMWRTGFGHGDATHVGELNLDNPGLEVWRITEGATKYDACMLDAKTGKVLNGQLYTSGDVGRGACLDIDPEHPGLEYIHNASGYVYDANGNELYAKNMGSNNGYPNYRIFWNEDLLDDHYSGQSITTFDMTSKSFVRCVKTKGNTNLLYKYYDGVTSINDSKDNPLILCDLYGDYREEIAMYSTGSAAGFSDCDYAIRIITTTYPTENKLPWLRDDHTYNIQIANQNVGYSMPPHLGYNAYAYNKNLQASTLTGKFNPDTSQKYIAYTGTRFLNQKDGTLNASATEYIEFSFIPTIDENVYLIMTTDGRYFADDAARHKIVLVDDRESATPYRGDTYNNGQVQFVSTKATDGYDKLNVSASSASLSKTINAKLYLFGTGTTGIEEHHVYKKASGKEYIVRPNGMRVKSMSKGLNIIRDANGRTKKVMIK